MLQDNPRMMLNSLDPRLCFSPSYLSCQRFAQLSLATILLTQR